MRNLMVLLGMIAALSCAFAEEQRPAFPYIVDGTNRITAILSESPTPSRKDLIKVSTIACDALKQLLMDQRFYEGLFAVANTMPDTAPERAKWVRDIELFNLRFLAIEQRTFERAGLDERATKSLVDALSKYRSSVSNKVDPKVMIDAMGRVKDDFCKSAVELQALEDKAVEQAQVAALAERSAWRWKGIAVIALDVGAAAAIIVGSGPAGAVVAGPAVTVVAGGSIAVGQDMMGRGKD